jgi:hypothetical protein
MLVTAIQRSYGLLIAAFTISNLETLGQNNRTKRGGGGPDGSRARQGERGARSRRA